MNKRLFVLNLALAAMALSSCGGASSEASSSVVPSSSESSTTTESSSSLAPSSSSEAPASSEASSSESTLESSEVSSEPSSSELSSEPSSSESSSEESSSEETSSEESSEESSSEESSEIIDAISVSEAKELEVGEEITVVTTLVAKMATGFYSKDATGCIFTYIGNEPECDIQSIPLGSKIKVHGYASVYYMSHQIGDRSNEDETVDKVEVELLKEATSEYKETYENKSVYDIFDEDNQNLDFYGTPVCVRGFITYSGVYNNPYALENEDGDLVYLSRYSLAELDYGAKQGEFVEIKGYVYCYSTGSFVLSGAELNDLSSDSVTDEEAVDAAIYYVKHTLEGLKTTKDIELPASYLGAEFEYFSNDPEVLGNDGTYYAPDRPTDVMYTIYVARGSVTKNTTVHVTALVVTAAHLVISEIFTAGGNKDAAYNCDFIELYNQTDFDINLNGYSLQNSSTGATSKFTVHNLSGTIKAHDYFLVRGKVKDTTPYEPINDYDLALDNFDPGASDLIVALANNTSQITYDYSTTGSTLTSDNVIDLVGVGKATLYEGEKVSMSGNANSLQRKDPEVDTDNNRNDFHVATPTPTKSKDVK